MPDKPFLSVVIPAYNEELRLPPVLDKIFAFEAQQNYEMEIIVVDDFSTDNTAAVIEAKMKGRRNCQVIRRPCNLGKGAAVRLGMMAAKGEYRLFSDADLSTPIEEVNKFLPLLQSNEFDVVIGSRRVAGANIGVRQPFYREAAGRFFSLLVRLIALKGLVDTQCGFKLFSHFATEEVFPLQTIRRFGFDVEILYIAQKRGLKIKEAPVTWIDSPNTKVQLFRDSADMFWDLVRIRWYDFRGIYDVLKKTR